MNSKKGNRSAEIHPGRIKKRRFSGNRYTAQNDTEYTSASAKKLKDGINIEVPIVSSFSYCILEFASVFSAISNSIICKECKSDVSFMQSSSRGLGFKIIQSCKCKQQKIINSCRMIQNACKINRRFVFVMRLLGIGHERTNLFCSFMDICSGIGNSTYYALLENIHVAAFSVFDHVIKFAATQVKNMNEEAGKPRDELAVSGDGTWKKRGFSSLFEVSSLIGKYTGKVLDAMVMSSFCSACNNWRNKRKTESLEHEIWYEAHESECSINHSGSSCTMEISAITQMFARSIEKHGVKYLTYIGDGDCKTFKGILDSKPYEETVIKKECVGHVEKRMGTRLRNAKKDQKNKWISGKGAGKLTNKLITEMTRYYGLTIWRHPDCIEKMKKEIWATFHHKCSSDENPQHKYCPEGEDSWCKWRQAETKDELVQLHHDKPPLLPAVQKAIKPIYEDLTRDELLTSCLGAETQNNNDSLNSLILTFAPKHLHSGFKIVEITTYLSVIIFNEGFQSVIKIMSIMECPIGREAYTYAIYRDEWRIARSEQRTSDAVKKARIQARKAQLNLQNFQEEEKGILHGPGIAD